MNKHKINMGIIGGGKIIPEAVQAMREQGDLIPCAVTSRPESYDKNLKLADELHIPDVYPDINSMLGNDDIDAVYIAVSNNAHFDTCKKALEASKHVIMEKPFCTDPDEADCLFDLASQKKMILMEAMPIRFSPCISKIKEWLNCLGEIYSVETNYLQLSSRYSDFLDGKNPAAFDPEKAGGALMDLGIYSVHFLLSLFSVPDNIQYKAKILKNADVAGELSLLYPNFTCHSAFAKDRDGKSGFCIKGQHGSISSDCKMNDITKVHLSLDDGTFLDFEDPRVGHRFIYEMDTFFDIVNHHDIPAANKLKEDTIASVKILNDAKSYLDN